MKHDYLVIHKATERVTDYIFAENAFIAIDKFIKSGYDLNHFFLVLVIPEDLNHPLALDKTASF